MACQPTPPATDKGSSGKGPAGEETQAAETPAAPSAPTSDAASAEPKKDAEPRAKKGNSPSAKKPLPEPPEPPPIEVSIGSPKYAVGAGPRVGIDEAHHNFHSLKTPRTKPFIDVLTQEGYRVEALSDTFTEEALANFDIVVIVNALHVSNAGEGKWRAPVEACLLYTSPSPRDRTRSRMPSSA